MSKKQKFEKSIEKEKSKTIEQRKVRSIDRMNQKQILLNAAGKHVEDIKTKLSNLKKKPTKIHRERLFKTLNDVKVLSQDLISHRELDKHLW